VTAGSAAAEGGAASLFLEGLCDLPTVGNLAEYTRKLSHEIACKNTVKT